MFKIKNYTDHGEIYLWGLIVDDTDASWLQLNDDDTIGYQFPTKIKEQLDELKGLPLDVHIASDGGDVAAGIAIYNMLSNHDAAVTVYIDSYAASIASFIAFAGQKIVMPGNTFLMIHNPKGGAFGEAEYLRRVADWLDKIRNMLADTYAKNAKDVDVETIKELMDKETWLPAREAEVLFKNVELAEDADMLAVAQYETSFKSAPEALKRRKETAEENIKKMVIKTVTEAFNYEEKG